MTYPRYVLLLCGMELFLAGCAAHKYRPAPISPSETAGIYEARNLNNPDLRLFIETNLGRPLENWPPKSWDPAMLTLAALYYQRDLGVARAGVGLAEAGVITAGARPNPSLRIAPGYSSSPESPWLFSISPTVPLETAGKRGHRIRTAERVTDVARLQLAEVAWKVRARLRAALLDFLLAQENLRLLRAEEQVRMELVRLLTQQFEAGAIPRTDLVTAQIDVANTKLAIRSAEGELAQARASLASAIGVPVGALDGLNFTWAALDQPPSLPSLSSALMQRTAVLNRLDIRRSLAEYAATEANLQLEVAKQYPDVQLGPGYSFDDGANKFTLGVSLVLPVFNRNQGPIAEVEARRKQAEQRFLALQAQVVAESEKALAAYGAALAELQEATEALKVQREKERLARKSYELGETDKLAMSGALLQTAAAERARLAALGRAQAALGAMEDAVQKPLEPAWLVAGLPTSDHPQTNLVKEPRK